MKSIRAISAILILLWAPVCRAQDDVITGFAGNGFITWTNSHTNGLFNVEWASYPEGPWQSSWTGLWNFATTASTISASVPMFYRVSWSTNVTQDLRISPSETTLLEDGNKVALTVTGGDGSYTWDVDDIALGNIDSGTGNSILYQRSNRGDNAVVVQSAGLRAYTVIHQP
jgi:hypothetical protein